MLGGELDLPCAAHPRQLFGAAASPEQLVDLGDGGRGWGLPAGQALGQVDQCAADALRIAEGPVIGPEMERGRPPLVGSGIGEPIGRGGGAAAGGVDEVEPEGVAEEE
jgi:hypothetical protein